MQGEMGEGGEGEGGEGEGGEGGRRPYAGPGLHLELSL